MAVAGDRVNIDRRDDAPGWHWCKHASSGLAGWTPEAFLDFEAGRSTAVLWRAYSAMELTVVEGQAVTVLDTVAGWSWCDAGNGAAGWVPSDRLTLAG